MKNKTKTWTGTFIIDKIGNAYIELDKEPEETQQKHKLATPTGA